MGNLNFANTNFGDMQQQFQQQVNSKHNKIKKCISIS
jgi:hypothetical protein